MAPVPATSDILYVTYEGVFGRRTVQCRWSTSQPPAEAATLFRNFLLNGVVPLWHTSTQVTSWSYRETGSTFSLPLAPPGAVVGTATSNIPNTDYPRYLSITARGGTDGREVRMSFYGLVFANQPDYRFTGSESTPVASIWAAAVTLAANGGFRTAGQSGVTVRPYANVGYNAYYQRKARRTS